MGLILTLLLGFLALWEIGLASFSIWKCLGMFKKYAKYGPIEDPDGRMSGFIRDDFNQWNRKKILIGCIIKLPIRLLIILNFIISQTFLMYIGGKLGGKNAAIMNLVGNYNRTYRKVLGRIVLTFDEDFEDCRVHTPVIISNHTNWFDPLYFLWSVGIVSYVAKKQVQKIPIFGPCADSIRCMYVDRKNTQARTELLNQMEARVREFADGKPTALPFTVFPEGTTNNGKKLVKFKTGAFETRTPITAYCFKYICEGCSLSMDEITTVDCVVLFLSQSVTLKVNRFEIRCGQNESVEDYMQKCQKMMAQKLGIPCTEGGYRDKVRMQEIRKQQLKAKSD